MNGIGIDIISICRMEEILQRSGERFLSRVFTAAERAEAASRRDPTAYFASAFAAKEAVFKLFGNAWECGADFPDAEILRGTQGEPVVILRGALAECLRAVPSRTVSLSLSYENKTAIAAAILF